MSSLTPSSGCGSCLCHLEVRQSKICQETLSWTFTPFVTFRYVNGPHVKPCRIAGGQRTQTPPPHQDQSLFVAVRIRPCRTSRTHYLGKRLAKELRRPIRRPRPLKTSLEIINITFCHEPWDPFPANPHAAWIFSRATFRRNSLRPLFAQRTQTDRNLLNPTHIVSIYYSSPKRWSRTVPDAPPRPSGML